MIGGARYYGTSPRHAKAVLDASQNASCYGYPAKGHPRGHASHPSATGYLDSVENYSRNGTNWKSGFLSRIDQDLITHLALSTRHAQNLMQKLNDGSVQERCVVSAEQLMESNGTIRSLPQWTKYLDGEPDEYGPRDIREVFLLLRHHREEYRNPYADVFVHTCYPTLY